MGRTTALEAVLLLAAGCATAPHTPAQAPAPAAAPTGAASSVSDKPRPPDDLDQRLVADYPLRGFVLRESGRARVRFTVEPSGAVRAGEVVEATRSEYGEACRRMLEATTWTPARSSGTPVAFSSVFDCRFEHAGEGGERGVSAPVIASPPVPPDYGKLWWERHSNAFATRDSSAELLITVSPDGRVRVDSMVAGGDPLVAQPCTAMLQQGPRWTPARDPAGSTVEYHGRFHCRLEVRSTRKELYVKQLGTLGPIAPARLAAQAADHFQDLVQCFESAVYLDKAVQGQHWLAFEIRPQGDVGRVEWIERVFGDAAIDACVIGAVRSWRFPAAAQRTIADIQLYLGGTG